MTTRFPCLNIEGGLFAGDLIDQIGDGTVQGQKPADFKLSPRTYLTDEIAAAWTDARSFWTAFQHRLERLPQEDTATSITRDQWMIPLLSLLGYELTYASRAAEVDGQTYAISHRAGQDENSPPVHIVGCRQSLDRRPESGRPRLAPHSLLQEYINRTEHLWGIATNGYTLRLLRDSQLIRRQAYIEFDLKQTMESEKFADFALLYRLVHRTRLPCGVEDASECLLERYHSITIEQGGRVRDHLRDGVEEALKILANGLLHHPKNQHLRERSKNGELNPYSSYQQLLRLIYRFLFLMVAEERNLITENQAYRDHYSISRLRYFSELRPAYSDHEDLWIGLQTTFRLFQDEELGKMLGVPPLNGDLFNTAQTPDLQGLSITNREFLTAIWDLSMYRENERTPWRRINYAALDVEELGSVYESLLDFQPVFTERDGKPTFELAYGMERKSTGSYYTPPELVNELIKSALVPVLEERLKEVKTPQEKEKSILNLKVCDPASGSGHFLLAAARRLGRELAKIRTGDDEPAPEQMRLAIRDAITHCIYAVDKNPLAVDLCKVALWMEGHAKGKPLTFLDHRIRCGDSLIGVLDLKVLEQGIPDEALDPVTGDDKQVARSLKKQNRSEREGQRSLPFEAKKEITSLLDAYQPLRELPDDTPEQIRRKVEAYQKIQSHGSKWWHDNTACHLWTAAFFAELTQENNKNNRIPTTETLRRYLETHAIDGRQIGNAWALAQKHHLFHWPLEFPDVFASATPSPLMGQKSPPSTSRSTGDSLFLPSPLMGEGAGGGVGGFDVVLGNPPWERIKLQEQEFFASRDPEIARVPNKAARERLIRQLPDQNPSLWHEFKDAKHSAEAQSKFMRHSGRYPLTARGDINTYAVFAELARNLINPKGRVGIIVPTGIATDDTCKHFFGDLVEKNNLLSLFDFENRDALFPSVHRSYKFCLFTLKGKTDKVMQLSEFVFFATRAEQIKEGIRRFTLSAEDFRLINPNTRTCPVFRTKADAELTKKIYNRVPVLVNEVENNNAWHIDFRRVFDMNKVEILKICSREPANNAIPMYEAKMIWQFDHRFGTYEGLSNRSSTHLPTPRPDQYSSSFFVMKPWYWIPADEMASRLPSWERKWLLGFRDITHAANERTAIFTILPFVGTDFTIRLAFPKETARWISCIIANANSLTFDYVCRQSVAGTHLADYITKQLPTFPPTLYTPIDLEFIVPRVLELVYTAWDVKPFSDDVWREADDVFKSEIKKQWETNRVATGGHIWNPPEWAEIAEDGIPLPPFKWDETRRATLRAQLDAYYAKLYGLTRNELRYILDPKEVYGPDFPGETFRVLKEKEEKQYGDYRTRRLVLQAWDRLDANGKSQG